MSLSPSTLCNSPCFFFNDTATTEIYTLSLHDALPISWSRPSTLAGVCVGRWYWGPPRRTGSTSMAFSCAPPNQEHMRSEEHTSELQSQSNIVCRLLLEKKKITLLAKSLLAVSLSVSTR